MADQFKLFVPPELLRAATEAARALMDEGSAPIYVMVTRSTVSVEQKSEPKLREDLRAMVSQLVQEELDMAAYRAMVAGCDKNTRRQEDQAPAGLLCGVVADVKS